MTRIILAKYDGTCPVCSHPIVAGIDRILYSRKGRTSYVEHEDCSDAREKRATRAHDAACEARFLTADGPLPVRPRDAERVACWAYLAAQGCYGSIVERWDGHLVIGRATFLGYEWRVCVDSAE